MKKLVIVLLALVVAGGAFAGEKIESSATAQLVGTIDNPMREAMLSFTDFTAAGAIFTMMDADPVSGSFSGAIGDFVLVTDGVNSTWCDDLTILIANEDLSIIHVQLGGFSDFGAAYRFGWPEGASSAGGTVGGGVVDFAEEIDVTGYYLFLGNGYGNGGDGVWTGTIQMLGSVVADEQVSFDSVKALYR